MCVMMCYVFKLYNIVTSNNCVLPKPIKGMSSNI